MDLNSGFWQIGRHPDDKDKTAFSTSQGLFQFSVMPFGFANSPSTFQCLMENIFRGLQWEECLVYMDDIIVFSATFNENIVRLEHILSRLKDANLLLKQSKWISFNLKLKFSDTLSPVLVSIQIQRRLRLYKSETSEKRRSDSVLWQKPLHPRKCQKGSDNTNNATKKFDKELPSLPLWPGYFTANWQLCCLLDKKHEKSNWTSGKMAAGTGDVQPDRDTSSRPRKHTNADALSRHPCNVCRRQQEGNLEENPKEINVDSHPDSGSIDAVGSHHVNAITRS